ncbi:Phosphoacetylglucosamine Mutase [Podochytrium sp. JEL0797]|nr:Phosphoacetylglucosamine Mutase [Podochytrium sp. JEL0797]
MFSQLSQALTRDSKHSVCSDSQNGFPRLSSLLIDGANGIGAPAMEKLGKYLGDSFAYELVNHDVVSKGKLNHAEFFLLSGADFVKIKQTAPLVEEDGTFRLLDGDKIATLAAEFIMDLAKQAQILIPRPGSKTPLNIGLVVDWVSDTELSHPLDLQSRINEQVAKFNKGRCFVRPSGTEDIVRVYADAEYFVCGIVFDSYGGVGERPVTFLP